MKKDYKVPAIMEPEPLKTAQERWCCVEGGKDAMEADRKTPTQMTSRERGLKECSEAKRRCKNLVSGGKLLCKSFGKKVCAVV
jgi:hypothetical protein